MSVEIFIRRLQEYCAPQVFNPWADCAPGLDVGADAPLLRAANLRRYLELRVGARYVFIAEALGYQGGHFSGMAMTSERILLGFHLGVRPQEVLGEDWRYARTSDPVSPLLKRTQREQGFNEPTATVMWGVLREHGVSCFDAVLWNIFPWHPYKGGEDARQKFAPSGVGNGRVLPAARELLTNRTPTSAELDVGIVFARELLALLPRAEVVAIGQKAAATLRRYGVECKTVPHPSMGGANRFKAAVAELWAHK